MATALEILLFLRSYSVFLAILSWFSHRLGHETLSLNLNGGLYGMRKHAYRQMSSQRAPVQIFLVLKAFKSIME